MPENTAPATELTSQYLTKVATDLEQNVKEQERVSAEITALQEQLVVLQHDHTVLVNMRQALGTTAVPPQRAAGSDTAAQAEARTAEPAAAEPAAKDPAKGTRGKDATTGRGRRKTAAKPVTKKPATASPAAKKSPATSPAAKNTKKSAAAPAAAKKPSATAPDAQSSQPKLIELVRAQLAEQKEPRSAAEVATALGEAHPGRDVKVTVVRSTLENLVARNQAQRTKQGTSVYYTPTETAPETKATDSDDQPAPAGA
ncbi:hypothetical protein ABZX30_10450 [Streptomyces sp. NPDC004542]|uniref:hypothetical protein n=1 Tax=Streptomyces sp. NPDC004542 TaxID=3154281 RepID=UPI00339ED245